MSVDKELEQALEDAEASVPAVAQAAGPGAPPPAKPKQGHTKLLIGLLVMVVGLLALVFTSFKGTYAVGVDKLVKEQDRYSQRSVNVTGILVKGTLMRRESPCEYRFKLKAGETVLPVAYRGCVVPDTFKDMPGMDVMVTAEGALAQDRQSFEAKSIMAKCPSKYEMQELAMSGQKAPHLGKQGNPLLDLGKE